MAQLHVQRKKRSLWWLWLIIVLLLVIASYYWYLNYYQAGEPPYTAQLSFNRILRLPALTT